MRVLLAGGGTAGHTSPLLATADALVVVLGAVLICFLATLYPSRQASRLDPVQALRFE